MERIQTRKKDERNKFVCLPPLFTDTRPSVHGIIEGGIHQRKRQGCTRLNEGKGGTLQPFRFFSVSACNRAKKAPPALSRGEDELAGTSSGAYRGRKDRPEAKDADLSEQAMSRTIPKRLSQHATGNWQLATDFSSRSHRLGRTHCLGLLAAILSLAWLLLFRALLRKVWLRLV